MIKYLFCLLLTVLLFDNVHAQSRSDTLLRKDSVAASTTAGGEEINKPDDEFNIFLLVVGVGFCGAVLGAVMAGAFVVFLLLGIFVLLTTAGMLSASLLAGLYKRSFNAGFKSLLLIAASLLGTAFGLLVLWIINAGFHLHLTSYEVVLAGAGGGLADGLLLGIYYLPHDESLF